jgi:hypothetical protein
MAEIEQTTGLSWAVMRVAKKVKYSDRAATKILGTLKPGTLVRVYNKFSGDNNEVVYFEFPPPPGGYWAAYVWTKSPANKTAWLADKPAILSRLGWTIKGALASVSQAQAAKAGGSGDLTAGKATVGEAGKPGSMIGIGSEVGPGKTTFKKEELDQYLPTPTAGPFGVPWWAIVALPVGLTWGAPIAVVAGAATWYFTPKA